MTDNFSFKTINGMDAATFAGKRVLLRLDLNVPIQKVVVTDGFRIQQSVKTVDFLRKAGAKVIVIAHLENKEYSSLDIVCKFAQKFFPATFLADPWSAEGMIALQNLKNGDVIIVENVRKWEGEKKNDPEFAKKLAALSDLYVNEAFSVSHRAHASIVGVPTLLPSFAGFNFEQEVAHLSRAFNPPHPYLFVLGGAKIETKAPLIKKFLQLADNVFVGGALANDLFRAKGFNVGGSIHGEQDFGFAEMLADPKLMLPIDVVVESGTEKKVTKKVGTLNDSDKSWDSGGQTITALTELIKKAKFILWNGPLGMFETGYTEGTYALARAIAYVTSQNGAGGGAESVVGGGDTLASIETLGLTDKFTFVSTAGGAMLDFLAEGTLAGIEAINKAK